MKQLPYTFKKTDPISGQCDTDEFLTMFPQGTIPAMDHNGFKLTESHAILPYLCDANGWSDLYPTDPKKRAEVNQWLHWHHTTMRLTTMYFFRPHMIAAMKGEPLQEDAKKQKRAHRTMDDTLLVMKFGGLLKGGKTPQKFVCGDTLTIADLCLYCEIDQTVALKTWDYSKYPEVSAWIDRMKQLPEHDSVRRALFKMSKIVADSKM